MTWWAEWLGWGEFNSWEIYWGAGNDLAAFLVLVVLVPPTLFWFWSSLFRVTLSWKKYLLFGLRILTLTLLLLILLQPRLEFKNVQPIPNSIAVLLDDSKSLSIKTFPTEKPRSDLVKDVLQKNGDAINRLKEKYRVDYYFASDHLSPVAEADAIQNYQPRGAYTDFTRSLKELQERYKGKSLQGVMLFSDGGDLIQGEGRLSPDLAGLLSELKGPVHTFQAGSNERFKDLAIERFEVSDFGFIHQPLTIRVTLRASGIGKKNVPLVLRENEKILVTRVVELNDEDTHYTAELDFTPTETGKRIYTLTVPVFSGESVETNNRKFFQVNVVRDRLRVLHLNGRPSWDSRFLREVLINNPKVDLLSFFILRTLSDDVQAPTAELSLIPFPSNLLFTDYLSSFDLVVFQNFKYVPFLDKKYLSNIKEYVNGGGAFLMVGGELSFQAGGYLNSPVEDILPVRMDRTAKQIQEQEFVPEISNELIHHPILQLEKREADNRNAWKKLPPLFGLNTGLKPAPGAQVLAVAGQLPKDSLPFLATARAGEGRSMIIASDTIWNWNFLKVGSGGSGRYYQKFWENVIDWMTGAPETHPLHLETDKEKYLEGEKVLLSFTALGEDYNPIPDAKLKLTLDVYPNTGKTIEKELTADTEGRGTFEFQPASEGFYTMNLALESEGTRLQNQIKFSVHSPTAEFDKPLVNTDLLKKMAQATGGSYQELGQGTPIENLNFPNPEIEIKTRSRSLSLWDNWWSYGLILSLLFAEWWIRRKAGLS